MAGLVYPRLSEADALVRFTELREAAEESVTRLRDMVGFSHERAAPVPTGGPVATPIQIRRLRESVIDDLGFLLNPNAGAPTGFRDFDWTLGRSLHQHIEIVTSDAAHRTMWNFLSLMVFPDVVWMRFSDPSEDRALGGPRNVLRRTWNRYEVLGGLDGYGAETLNEDELVQLTERTSLARNRRLVNALARRVVAHEGPRRMEYTRELAKRATFITGPLLLDVLSDEQLDDLVDAIARDRRWDPSPVG